MSKCLRSIILKRLIKIGYPAETAKKYELEVLRMCKRIHGSYADEKTITLDDVYTYYAYEKLGDLSKAIKDVNLQHCIMEDLQKDHIKWDAAVYSHIVRNKRITNEMAIADVKIEEGDFVCGKCGSKKCYFTQEQDRSRDEGMTSYITCVRCKHRKKDNF